MPTDDHDRVLTAAFNQILDATKHPVLDEHAEALRAESHKLKDAILKASTGAVDRMVRVFDKEKGNRPPAMFVATAMLASGVIAETARMTGLTHGQMTAVFVRVILDHVEREFES